jgi:hypothetical protein
LDWLIDYITLFSGHALNIVPELTKECAKDSVWHVFSDFIRDNYTQDNIKSCYLLVLESYNEFNIGKNNDQSTYDIYGLHLDILWQALTDENCAKIELHIRQ